MYPFEREMRLRGALDSTFFAPINVLRREGGWTLFLPASNAGVAQW